MFHRFIGTVRLAVFGLLAIGASQTAVAEIYNYDGTMFFCTGICSSFAALGAPVGGVENEIPSNVTGFIEINVEPDGTFTEANIVDYGFTIFNSNVLEETAIFAPDPDPRCDGLADGDLCNATVANPLPLDSRVVTFDVVPGYPFAGALFGGTGTTGPNNELTSGQLVATFTVPPFNPNGAQVYFDLSTNPCTPPPPPEVPLPDDFIGCTQGYLFGGVVLFTGIAGDFSQLPGAISVADNPTVFDDTAIGETAVADITVTNTGDGPLTISSVATADTVDAPFSITDDGCSGMTLASMGSCVLATAFSPTVMGGLLEDSFDIVSDDPDFPSITVDVSGTALEPNIQVTPLPLSFVQTSTAEVSQAVTTITNTGTAPLIIGTIDFGVLDPVFSAVLDDCSMQTLAPAEFCQITMEFAPVVEGMFASNFVIPSNDIDEPSFTYGIEGEGIIGTIVAITVIPTSLTFDQILVSEMSELGIQVSSTGTDSLTLNSFAFSGADAVDFSETNECPAVLDSGLNCTITVIFAPLSGGAKSATLTIDSDADETPLLPVEITGDAFDGPRIVVDPTALDLGSPSAPVDIGTTATADVTVSNTGNADLNVDSLSIVDVVRGGVPATEFVANGCLAPVAPLGSCTITVAFSPLTEADKMAQLIIVSDDTDNPSVTVDLTGYVFRGARIDVPSTSIDVDGGTEVEVEQSANFNLIITNSGTQDLDISGFALGGTNAEEFSFTETCTGGLVATQGTCTVTITFAPTSAGEKSAELSIFSNDVTLVRAATFVIALSATAVPMPVEQPADLVPPPAFARSDPGGGALGVGLLGLGLLLLIARRRYR